MTSPGPKHAAADLTPLKGMPVTERLDWVLRALVADQPPAGAELEDVFDPAMLALVPVAHLQAAFGQLAAKYEVTVLAES